MRCRAARDALDEPESDQEGREGEEVVEEEVGLRLERAGDDARGDEDEQQDGQSSTARTRGARSPATAATKPGEEEPELHVQGHDVGRAHDVERRGLECRHERRVRRVRELPEELVVEPSEEVDRLGLGNPERPAVPVGQGVRRPARKSAST